MEEHKNPSFSVIIPTYNRADRLKKAISSVLQQTYNQFELIIIDDCSTDNTDKVVAAFDDPRMRYFRATENRGPGASRNLGIKKSKGKFISFLDSDDYYYPRFLEKSLKTLTSTKPKIGFMWTGLEFVFQNGEKEWTENIIFTPSLKPGQSVYLRFLEGLKIGTNSGITIKKEVFTKVGLFDERLRAAEDTDLFLRIAQHYHFTYTKEVLIRIFRSHDDRVSKDFRKVAEAYDYILQKHLPTIEQHPALTKRFLYKLTWLNYHADRKQQARKYFRQFINHFSISKRLWLIIILFEVLPLNWAKNIHFWLNKTVQKWQYKTVNVLPTQEKDLTKVPSKSRHQG